MTGVMKHAWRSPELNTAFRHTSLHLEVCLNSKRISDLLVGVEHDSKAGADGFRGQVSSEFGANEATLTVRGGHLTPNTLVVNACLSVLGFVDESNSLAVVGHSFLAVGAALQSDEGRIIFLRALSSLEAHEDALCIESIA